MLIRVIRKKIIGTLGNSLAHIIAAEGILEVAKEFGAKRFAKSH